MQTKPTLQVLVKASEKIDMPNSHYLIRREWMGVEPTTERKRPDTDFEDQEAHRDLTTPANKDKQCKCPCQPSAEASVRL